MARKTKKEFDKVVERVRNGDYKDGEDRIKALTEEGWNYADIQNRVNELEGSDVRYEAEDYEVESMFDEKGDIKEIEQDVRSAEANEGDLKEGVVAEQKEDAEKKEGVVAEQKDDAEKKEGVVAEQKEDAEKKEPEKEEPEKEEPKKEEPEKDGKDFDVPEQGLEGQPAPKEKGDEKVPTPDAEDLEQKAKDWFEDKKKDVENFVDENKPKVDKFVDENKKKVDEFIHEGKSKVKDFTDEYGGGFQDSGIAKEIEPHRIDIDPKIGTSGIAKEIKPHEIEINPDSLKDTGLDSKSKAILGAFGAGQLVHGAEGLTAQNSGNSFRNIVTHNSDSVKVKQDMNLIGAVKHLGGSFDNENSMDRMMGVAGVRIDKMYNKAATKLGLVGKDGKFDTDRAAFLYEADMSDLPQETQDTLRDVMALNDACETSRYTNWFASDMLNPQNSKISDFSAMTPADIIDKMSDNGLKYQGTDASFRVGTDALQMYEDRQNSVFDNLKGVTEELNRNHTESAKNNVLERGKDLVQDVSTAIPLKETKDAIVGKELRGTDVAKIVQPLEEVGKISREDAVERSNALLEKIQGADSAAKDMDFGFGK